MPWIVAPMGASAVLLFAVPASPMAQPWPLFAGSALSALVGFAIGQWLGADALACGLAVGLSLAVMSLARALHPPGAALALMAVLGGAQVEAAGWWFPLAPVAVNALVLIGVGWLFHRLAGRSYPHAPSLVAPTRDPLPTARVGVREEDIDAVLARIGESFDIERDDLRLLLTQLETQVLARQRADLSCGEIMSRDVIAVRRDDDPAEARRLLLESGVRLLPVLGDGDRPLGSVGLRELAQAADTVAAVMAPPLTITPERPALELTGALTDGRRHAAMVVDPQTEALLGLVSQADLLAALARDLVDAGLTDGDGRKPVAAN